MREWEVALRINLLEANLKEIAYIQRNKKDSSLRLSS